MVATKRRLLARTGPLAPGHQVLVVDAFAADGPTSLAGLAGRLDPDRGTAVITEGLLNYFSTPSVCALWKNVAQTLRSQGSGLYLADIALGPARTSPVVGMALTGLRAAARGRVAVHFAGAGAATEQLLSAGFATADVRRIDHWPAAAPWKHDPATRWMHVLTATTG
jgi:O-methyltransferase involved in polyketide biosynthesis